MPNVILRPEDLHWIDRANDNPTDQCAHGEVELSIDGVTFVAPKGGDWNLTAAGLFLLRTLTADNSPAAPVCESNHLIPCCGMNPWVVDGGRYPLTIQGCNRGVNVFVQHQAEGVKLSTGDGHQAIVSIEQWRGAVLDFTAAVEAWYAQSSAKATPDDEYDAQGWRALWQEWKSRREAALHAP